jgi:hypothetical protein
MDVPEAALSISMPGEKLDEALEMLRNSKNYLISQSPTPINVILLRRKIPVDLPAVHHPQ